MRTLYLDCSMGAAGDMLTAALLELFPNKEEIVKELNALGIPGVAYETQESTKCGIVGTHMSVKVHGEEEGEHEHHHEHDHDHDHDHHHDHDHEHHHHDHDHEHHHEHHHHHSSMADIEHIVEHLNVSEQVKANVMEVYRLIADAESKAHGKPVEEIHFHEVGAMDAVADVTAVCFLMEKLAADRIIVSPIHVGSGQVKCAHGIMPVPAPATAHILTGVPIYGGSIRGELCTPTGAALLKKFANSFGQMPALQIAAIGYGMGKKDFEAANCVRAMLGDTGEEAARVAELSCNMDDCSPEVLGLAMECLLRAGALDVFTTAIGMKKSRPGVMLTVLCKEADKQQMVEMIFKYTTTIGIRESICNRYTLNRRTEVVDTEFGLVRKKISTGYGVNREKFEYEDLAKISREHNMSIAEITDIIEY